MCRVDELLLFSYVRWRIRCLNLVYQVISSWGGVFLPQSVAC
jgi:hypothetical protein